MLELVGGAAVFLFGLAFIAGLVLLAFAAAQHWLPPLRRVRFADAHIQRSVPARVRWLRWAGTSTRRRWRGEPRPGATRALLLLRTGQLMQWVVVPGAAIAAVVVAFERELDTPALLLLAAAAWTVPKTWGRLRSANRANRRDRARRLIAGADEVLSRDPRPPIVLLRPFDSDGREVDALVTPASGPRTFEEVLVSPLARHAPVLAIGRPAETLPQLGAHREYIDVDWQDRVRERIASAPMLIVVVDESPGLLWELEQVFALALHPRTVLVTPGGDDAEAARHWRAAQDVAVRARTDLAPRFSDPPARSIAAVFETDGTVRFIVASRRTAEYYRDAILYATWWVARFHDAANSSQSRNAPNS